MGKLREAETSRSTSPGARTLYRPTFPRPVATTCVRAAPVPMKTGPLGGEREVRCAGRLEVLNARTVAIRRDLKPVSSRWDADY